MSIRERWHSITYHLSGRANLERSVPIPKLKPMDLPLIQEPSTTPPTSPEEKRLLEEKRRLQELELARLKAILMGKDIAYDE